MLQPVRPPFGLCECLTSAGAMKEAAQKEMDELEQQHEAEHVHDRDLLKASLHPPPPPSSLSLSFSLSVSLTLSHSLTHSLFLQLAVHTSGVTPDLAFSDGDSSTKPA